MAGVTVNLTGQAMAASQGTFSVWNVNPMLTGQSMTMSQGDITNSVVANVTVSLNGQSMTLVQDNIWVAPASVLVFLTGQEMTMSQAEYPWVTNITVELQGQQMTVQQKGTNPDVDIPESLLEEFGETFFQVITTSPDTSVDPDPNIYIEVDWIDRIFNVDADSTSQYTFNILEVADVNEWSFQQEPGAGAAFLTFQDFFDDSSTKSLFNHTPDTDSIGLGWQQHHLGGVAVYTARVQSVLSILDTNFSGAAGMYRTGGSLKDNFITKMTGYNNDTGKYTWFYPYLIENDTGASYVPYYYFGTKQRYDGSNFIISIEENGVEVASGVTLPTDEYYVLCSEGTITVYDFLGNELTNYTSTVYDSETNEGGWMVVTNNDSGIKDLTIWNTDNINLVL